MDEETSDQYKKIYWNGDFYHIDEAITTNTNRNYNDDPCPRFLYCSGRYLDKEKNNEKYCQRKMFLLNIKNEEDIKGYENFSVAVETKENNIFDKEDNIIPIICRFNKTLTKSVRLIIIID